MFTKHFARGCPVLSVRFGTISTSNYFDVLWYCLPGAILWAGEDLASTGRSSSLFTNSSRIKAVKAIKRGLQFSPLLIINWSKTVSKVGYSHGCFSTSQTEHQHAHQLGAGRHNSTRSLWSPTATSMNHQGSPQALPLRVYGRAYTYPGCRSPIAVLFGGRQAHRGQPFPRRTSSLSVFLRVRRDVGLVSLGSVAAH